MKPGPQGLVFCHSSFKTVQIESNGQDLLSFVDEAAYYIDKLEQKPDHPTEDAFFEYGTTEPNWPAILCSISNESNQNL